jgi:uncharacterized protein YqgC (DUF456 family)
MDIVLFILAGILILLGAIGSLLPVLPGPPLAWVGILLAHFSSTVNYSTKFLVITAVVMILITVLDYFIPIWGTKRFGGTKAGVIGCTLGLVVGLFFGPLGIILGPFLGALIGELAVNQKELKKALKSATGSFVGFVVGTGLKLVFCGFMAYYFVSDVIF